VFSSCFEEKEEEELDCCSVSSSCGSGLPFLDHSTVIGLSPSTTHSMEARLPRTTLTFSTRTEKEAGTGRSDKVLI
jgi:hypothetical protein